MTSDLPSSTEPLGQPYLAELNAEQRSAVEALEGPVLVLAGAGTGKTRVLTTRLVHLLVTGRATPGQILAVTFTNKAAKEMRDRVAASLMRPVEGWWLGTFHALCARVLRREAEKIGLKSNFSILDTDDQLRLLKQVMESRDIDGKKWPARLLLPVIQRWKDRALTPDKVPTREAGDLADGQLVDLYRAYQDRLVALNACDFGDLILNCLTLFQENPDVLADYTRRFHYILVDEYQDINVAQYLWLRLLAQEHRNICCVGDDDQSIYGWRGAEVGNILRFESDFPGANVVRLERNYRSTPRILAAASHLIAKNKSRLGKTLWTEGEEGEVLRIRGLWDGEAEARFVGEEIEARQRAGDPLFGMAILLRTVAQSREFEERFITLGLPYRIVGGARFYERLEIRDALAYLRVLHTPDHDLAFERILNKPKRGLGDATLSLLHLSAREADCSLHHAAGLLVQTDELRPQARRSLTNLLEERTRWRDLLRSMPHPELAELLLEESGYIAMWQNDRSPEAPGRLENLKELVNAMAGFDSLEGFLEHVSLVMENVEAEGQDMVNIMTLHAAKGLEFDTVFLPGWEEGLFPNQRALDESGNRALEEERRLAYVGLTRARRRVILSFAANRRLHGSWTPAIPSRFIDELPRDQVKVESDQGLYGLQQRAPGGLTAFHEAGQNRPWFDEKHGPGARRARARAGQTLDLRARPVGNGSGAKSFERGARVFHRKFGYGTVNRVEGERLDISFDKAGDKKVIASFLVPAEFAN
jgi:DNA helicase-2/ATP-dependent DNA helicase PcrA